MGITFQIPVDPNADGTPKVIKLRARSASGAGKESVGTPFIPTGPRKVRQIYDVSREGKADWVDVTDASLANIMRQIAVRTGMTETGQISQAISLTTLTAKLDDVSTASASAVEALNTLVETQGDNIEAVSERLTRLSASLDNLSSGNALANAIQSLTSRVTANETGITGNAAQITALETAIGGRTLGPETNKFSGTDKAAAETARDTYATNNPTWLARYDANSAINIELSWGALYIYQRRVNNAWVDNGEALAKASAVTGLNTLVQQQGTTLRSLTTRINNLFASIGTFTASAFAELTARVTRTENVEGSTKLAGLARWLVKTRVGDLVGGIGLFNDGGTVNLIVTADKFAIVPTGWDNTDPDQKRIPFVVNNGIVYIDGAAIQNASIKNAAIESLAATKITGLQATFNELRVSGGQIVTKSVHGDRIVDASIARAALELGIITEAYIADAAVNNAKIGNIIKSGSYNGKDNPNLDVEADLGNQGWLLNKNGKAVFDAAAIRGKIRAKQIEADVRNWDGLWSGYFRATKTEQTLNLSQSISPGADLVGIQIAYVQLGTVSPEYTYVLFFRNIGRVEQASVIPLLGGQSANILHFTISSQNRISVRIQSNIAQASVRIRQIFQITYPRVSTSTPTPTPSGTFSTLNQVSGITVSTGTATGTLNVSWTAYAGATGYRVRYSTNNVVSSADPFVDVSGGSTTSRVLTGLTGGTTYWIDVLATDGTRFSLENLQANIRSAVAKSAAGSTTPTSTFSTSGQVSGFTATTGGRGEIDLSWNAYPEAEGYLIYAGTSASTANSISGTALPNTGTATSYTAMFTNNAIGTIRYFRIFAYKRNNLGSFIFSVASPVVSARVGS